MSYPSSRPACFALLFSLLGLADSVQAANIGVNLSTRTSTQNLPQTVLVDARRTGMGSVAAPPPVYTGPGYGHRGHVYNRDTQFDGMGDSSATTKLPK